MKLRKSIRSKEHKIPASIHKLAAMNGNRYQLLILLDSCPFVEVYDNNKSLFSAKLGSWSWENLDSLTVPVDCRFFLSHKTKQLRYKIHELTIER